GTRPSINTLKKEEELNMNKKKQIKKLLTALAIGVVIGQVVLISVEFYD
ncbi:hypothetical protein D350_02046, partial [Enterococcus faecalis VC1B-1]